MYVQLLQLKIYSKNSSGKMLGKQVDNLIRLVSMIEQRLVNNLGKGRDHEQMHDPRGYIMRCNTLMQEIYSLLLR